MRPLRLAPFDAPMRRLLRALASGRRAMREVRRAAPGGGAETGRRNLPRLPAAARRTDGRSRRLLRVLPVRRALPRAGGVRSGREGRRRAPEGPRIRGDSAERGRTREGLPLPLCPVCHKLMNRSNYGSGSGVIVDVCGPHGVFFDRGELTPHRGFSREGRLGPREEAREGEDGRGDLRAGKQEKGRGRSRRSPRRRTLRNHRLSRLDPGSLTGAALTPRRIRGNLRSAARGQVSEWFKEHGWKPCVAERLPWVRIPPCPPLFRPGRKRSGTSFALPGVVPVRGA